MNGIVHDTITTKKRCAKTHAGDWLYDACTELCRDNLDTGQLFAMSTAGGTSSVCTHLDSAPAPLLLL